MDQGTQTNAICYCDVRRKKDEIMRKYLVSGVAAVALSWSMTLVAQPAGKPAASTTTSAQTTLNADQKSMYDSWPAEQRGGSVCLNRDRQGISGSSAGCFLELPIWGVV